MKIKTAINIDPKCKGVKKGKRLRTSYVSVPIAFIHLSNNLREHIYQFFLSLFLQTIKSRDAWNSTESSTDFPCCYFDICHVNNANNSFFCEINAFHEGDSAHAEVVAYFERVSFKWSVRDNVGNHHSNSKNWS